MGVPGKEGVRGDVLSGRAERVQTPWAGGIYKVQMAFPDGASCPPALLTPPEYPSKPPKCTRAIAGA